MANKLKKFVLTKKQLKSSFRAKLIESPKSTNWLHEKLSMDKARKLITSFVPKYSFHYNYCHYSSFKLFKEKI